VADSKDKSRHGEQLTTRLRAVLLRSMEINDERGKTLAQLVADAALDNPMLFLEKAARYLPKDVNVNHQQEGLIEIISALQRLRQSTANPPPLPVDNTNSTIEHTVTH
jgi:hypothetical protein